MGVFSSEFDDIVSKMSNRECELVEGLLKAFVDIHNKEDTCELFVEEDIDFEKPKFISEQMTLEEIEGLNVLCDEVIRRLECLYETFTEKSVKKLLGINGMNSPSMKLNSILNGSCKKIEDATEIMNKIEDIESSIYEGALLTINCKDNVDGLIGEKLKDDMEILINYYGFEVIKLVLGVNKLTVDVILNNPYNLSDNKLMEMNKEVGNLMKSHGRNLSVINNMSTEKLNLHLECCKLLNNVLNVSGVSQKVVASALDLNQVNVSEIKRLKIYRLTKLDMYGIRRKINRQYGISLN